MNEVNLSNTQESLIAQSIHTVMYNITKLQANSKLQTASQSECAKVTS